MKIMTTLLLTLTSFSLYAQEGVEGIPPRDQGLWQTMIMVSVALVFFYFILWRPEQQRRKEKDEQMKKLKKGDRVNAMGIIGTVIRVQDQTVILKMYDGSKIEFIKTGIQEVVPGTEDDVKKAEKEERSLPAAD